MYDAVKWRFSFGDANLLSVTYTLARNTDRRCVLEVICCRFWIIGFSAPSRCCTRRAAAIARTSYFLGAYRDFSMLILRG